MNAATRLEELVRIPSPTGEEADAVAYMQDAARDDGLTVSTDSAGNFLAEAGKGDKLVLWVGHIDTVPGHIPVRVENGELWGRGSVDAKGCLVTAYEAAKRHLDDDNIRIQLVGAVDEEGASRGARAIDRSLDPSYMIVGEPSGMNGITVGYRGIVRGTFECEGEVTHAGYPEPGALDRVTSWWETARRDLHTGFGFEDVTLRMDHMHSETDGLVHKVTGSVQARLPPGRVTANVSGAMRTAALQERVSVNFQEQFEPVLSSHRTPLVAALLTSIRRQGRSPRLLRKTGTADMNLLGMWWPDVPLCAYGPGDSSLDHTPHERLALNELDVAIDVFDDTLNRLGAL